MAARPAPLRPDPLILLPARLYHSWDSPLDGSSTPVVELPHAEACVPDLVVGVEMARQRAERRNIVATSFRELDRN